jgi:hypothetical protein
MNLGTKEIKIIKFINNNYSKMPTEKIKNIL